MGPKNYVFAAWLMCLLGCVASNESASEAYTHTNQETSTMALVPVGPAPGGPFSTVLAPSDGDTSTAEDLRRIAGVMLANDLQNSEPDPFTFDNGLTVNQTQPIVDTLSITTNGTGRAISASGHAYIGSVAANTISLETVGTGTGAGASHTGGANGPGAIISAGGGNNPGLRAYGTGTGAAVTCEAGGIEFNGAQPVATADPGPNVVHATHIDKAWALITTDGAGNASIVDGVNVASVSVVGGAALHITLAGAMASANYGVSTTDQLVPAAGVARTFHADGATNTASLAKIGGRTITAGSVVVVDFGAESLRLLVRVTGRQ